MRKPQNFRAVIWYFIISGRFKCSEVQKKAFYSFALLAGFYSISNICSRLHQTNHCACLIITFRILILFSPDVLGKLFSLLRTVVKASQTSSLQKREKMWSIYVIIFFSKIKSNHWFKIITVFFLRFLLWHAPVIQLLITHMINTLLHYKSCLLVSISLLPSFLFISIS